MKKKQIYVKYTSIFFHMLNCLASVFFYYNYSFVEDFLHYTKLHSKISMVKSF